MTPNCHSWITRLLTPGTLGHPHVVGTDESRTQGQVREGALRLYAPSSTETALTRTRWGCLSPHLRGRAGDTHSSGVSQVTPLPSRGLLGRGAAQVAAVNQGRSGGWPHGGGAAPSAPGQPEHVALWAALLCSGVHVTAAPPPPPGPQAWAGATAPLSVLSPLMWGLPTRGPQVQVPCPSPAGWGRGGRLSRGLGTSDPTTSSSLLQLAVRTIHCLPFLA